MRPQKIDGAYRLGFVLRGEKLGSARPLVAVGEADRQRHEGDRQVARAASSTARAARRSRARSGSSRGSSTALKQGAADYLWVLGLISLSLALLNLLPLLPLDGGHIAFSIVEGVRGRAVGREVYERVSVVGIALVLFLFFIGLSNDIGRLSGARPG